MHTTNSLINKRTLKSVFLFLPIFITLYVFIQRNTDYTIYEPWGLEDGIFESIQVAAYFMGAIIALLSSILFFHKKQLFTGITFVIIFLSSFVVGMEEISWLQRTNDIDSIAFLIENNVQQETNLHNNIAVYDSIRYLYITLGLVGSFGWIINLVPLESKLISFFKMYVPEWFTATYFSLLLINLWDTWWAAPQDLEYIETLTAVGIFLYIINLVIKLHGKINTRLNNKHYT